MFEQVNGPIFSWLKTKFDPSLKRSRCKLFKIMKGHGPKNPPLGCNLGGLPQLKLKKNKSAKCSVHLYGSPWSILQWSWTFKIGSTYWNRSWASTATISDVIGQAMEEAAFDFSSVGSLASGKVIHSKHYKHLKKSCSVHSIWSYKKWSYKNH